MRRLFFVLLALTLSSNVSGQEQQDTSKRPEILYKTRLPKDDARLAKLKAQAMVEVDSMAKFTQQMIDQLFSFGELGFQEIETSKYLTDVLEKNGFTVQRGIVGIPTAWVATWGSGKPVIALGSDLDGIPQASQK